MKLSLVHLASTFGRWLAPATLAAATVVGSLGVSTVASAQEARFHGAPGAIVAPGPRGVVVPSWRARHHRFWGPSVMPGVQTVQPWGRWRSGGFRGRAYPGGFHGGFRGGGFHGGGFHGGGGGFHGGGGGFHGGRR